MMDPKLIRSKLTAVCLQHKCMTSQCPASPQKRVYFAVAGSAVHSTPHPRGTPTPGSWPGVGGGNYSDAGVGEKCLDCAEEKRTC